MDGRAEPKEKGSQPDAGSLSRAVLRPNDFQSRTIQVDGLRMHAVVEGPEDGPLVVMLHGFPEFWYSWRYQIKALAAAGYRTVAVDQRGYNLTDKWGPYDVFTHLMEQQVAAPMLLEEGVEELRYDGARYQELNPSGSNPGRELDPTNGPLTLHAGQVMYRRSSHLPQNCRNVPLRGLRWLRGPFDSDPGEALR